MGFMNVQGPTRTENMDEKTANRLLELLEQSPSIHTVDFTGGAPELNPNFKLMIQKIRKMVPPNTLLSITIRKKATKSSTDVI